MSHKWKNIDTNIASCIYCGCIREKRVEKLRYWRHYIVYTFGGKEFRKAPECTQVHDTTLNMFENAL